MALSIVVFALLWTLFGSLWSVLLVRLGEKQDKETLKSILRWRSVCPLCHTTLQPKHLIPLFSFLWQRGKCAACGQKISRLYPVLEMGSALVFVLTFLWFQYMGGGIIAFRCAVNWLLFLLMVYDVIKYELHVPLWIVLLIVAGLPQLVGYQGNYLQAFRSVLVFVVWFLVIFLGAKGYIYLRYHTPGEGLGEGDIYLAWAIGLLMPFVFSYHHLAYDFTHLISLFVLFVFLSSAIGIVLWLILWCIKRSIPSIWTDSDLTLFADKILIPFLPAMIISFWLLLLYAPTFLYFFAPFAW